jgi:hypothetical protein
VFVLTCFVAQVELENLSASDGIAISFAFVMTIGFQTGERR